MAIFIDEKVSSKNINPPKFYPLRDPRWITNSHRDMIDIWLNLILLLLGLGIIFFGTNTQVISEYYIDDATLELSSKIKMFFSIIGSLNLFRIFFAEKLKVIWIVLFQSLTFFSFLYLSIDSFMLGIHHVNFMHSVNEHIGVYSVLSMAALMSVFKAK